MAGRLAAPAINGGVYDPNKTSRGRGATAALRGVGVPAFADVGRQREQAASEIGNAGGRRRGLELGGAEGEDVLVEPAISGLESAVEDQSAEPIFAGDADFGAVEDVLRLERIGDVDARS